MRALVLWLLLAGPLAAETVVASRTIRPEEIIGPGDLVLGEGSAVGGITDPAQLVGKEARRALYAGRPVRPGDVGPPAVVERNAIIPLVYTRNGVTISTEGRALDRAGPGDVIRVMNLASRATVSARIGPNGAGHVSQ